MNNDIIFYIIQNLRLVKMYFSLVFLNLFILYTAADCPYGYLGWDTTPEDKKYILDRHNELRRKIANAQVEGQPRGVNLKKLKWDNSLSGQALDVALGCEYGRVPIYDDRWPTVGQNQALFEFSDNRYNANWEATLNVWFNERSRYEYPNSDYKKAIDYTQMVWAETEYVGCGWTHYRPGSGDWKYNMLYVCNYGTGGNIVGEPPYETGESGCEDLC